MDLAFPSVTDWSARRTEQQVEEMDPDLKERAEMFAWTYLAALTAYQIGVAPVVVRPVAAGCAPIGTYLASTAGGMPGLSPMGSWAVSFTWLRGCSHTASTCGCSELAGVRLPGPVGGIDRVTVGGEVLDPSEYRYAGGMLIRTDGGAWPSCEDETFRVAYYRGMAPNAMTRLVAGILANEFYALWTGEADCSLPREVTSMTRQGATYEFEPPSFEEGTTGIDEVDKFIRVLNPNRLKTPVTIASPDSGPDYGRRVGMGRWW